MLEPGDIAERILDAREHAARIIRALVDLAAGVDAFDRHVELVVGPPRLAPERVPLEELVAARVIGPLGATAEPIDLRDLPAALVPLVPRLAAGWVYLPLDQADRVAEDL